MKKTLCIFLCVLLIMQFSTTALANTSVADNLTSKAIHLELSSDEQSREMMQKSGLEKFGLEKSPAISTYDEYSSTKNGFNIWNLGKNTFLEILLKKVDKVDNGLKISGCFDICVNGKTNTFNFTDAILEEKRTDTADPLYVGVLSSGLEIDEVIIPVLIDFASTTNFENAVAGVSIGTLENNAGILFFGESFPAYNQYVAQTLKEYEYQKEEIGANDERSYVSGVSVPSSDWYEHAGYAVNKKMGTTTGTKETVIVTAAKRDFSDTGYGIGFEMIRVFARDANAKELVSGATSAIPIKAIVTFTSNSTGFINIDTAYPGEGSFSMPSCFAILGNLHTGISTALAIIESGLDAILSGVNHTKVAASGGGYKEIKVEMNIASSTANSANLPQNKAVADAVGDTENGVACKVEYKVFDSTATSGQVTSKGKIQYRIYNGTHNTAVVSTGDASVPHYIWK